VILISLSTYKEKEYVRCNNGFLRLVSVALRVILLLSAFIARMKLVLIGDFYITSI
jgi:hypothetical protein